MLTEWAQSLSLTKSRQKKKTDNSQQIRWIVRLTRRIESHFCFGLFFCCGIQSISGHQKYRLHVLAALRSVFRVQSSDNVLQKFELEKWLVRFCPEFRSQIHVCVRVRCFVCLVHVREFG